MKENSYPVTRADVEQAMIAFSKPIDWSKIPREILEVVEEETGRVAREFEQFLINGGACSPVLAFIDRKDSFDPEAFFGEPGWFVEEESEKSLKKNIFFFEDLLRSGGYNFDAKVLEYLFHHQEKIPSRAKKLRGGIPFYGTILSHNGLRYTLSLVWREGK